ncbi:MFS transporter [Yinghuangia seranimata]|uniref:MFS transporter n=1 Tax=Yinghuangia seranimata TaxID=408067 RepID=UPI00248C76AD|nr:MFS transporter [Yinghuangia seranimata]MDI2130432.1 MFS transporter [Yinghuangia seranimata]
MTTNTTATGISNGRKWGTLAIGCLAALMLTIDMGALHLAIPGLINDLDPSSTQLLWIADGYGFALAGLLVTMGWLGDRIGRKRLLLAGTAAFSVASVLTAYATTPEMLIAARALLGVAGATIMPSTLSLIRNVFTDPKERTAAVGIWSGVSGAGVGLGPILGGLMLDHFWWGSVFLVNLPIMAVLFVAGLIVLPESRNPRPGRLDVPSVPLSIVGILGLVYAVKEAAHGGVAQNSVLVSALIGAVALTLFVVRQTRVEEPLIDVRLFRERAFAGAITANAFAMFALVAQSLIFAQYFQFVLGWSPLKSGLAGLPGAVAAMTGGALAAGLITKLGRGRTIGLGLAVSAAGFTLYTLTGTASNYPTLVAAMLPVGFGMGMAMTVTADMVLAAVPKERAGAASAISETATELGGALGMAVLGSVLNSAYRGNLELPAGVPAESADGAKDSLGGAVVGAAHLPGDLAGRVVDAAQHAFVGGMHVAALVSAGLALLTAVAATYALRGVPATIEENDADEADTAQEVALVA